MAKEIPLTKGYVAIVDDEDYDLVSQYHWHASITNDGKVYAKRKAKVRGKWSHVSMHRFLTNPRPDEVVDHINRNTLDNRRCNLRVVDHRTNLMNSGARKHNTSGYKGVYQYRSGRWRARIWDGKGGRINIGYFDSAEEAARAYDEEAVKQGIKHGLNFP